jgi:hypothetical protein
LYLVDIKHPPVAISHLPTPLKVSKRSLVSTGCHYSISGVLAFFEICGLGQPNKERDEDTKAKGN